MNVIDVINEQSRLDPSICDQMVMYAEKRKATQSPISISSIKLDPATTQKMLSKKMKLNLQGVAVEDIKRAMIEIAGMQYQYANCDKEYEEGRRNG